MKRTLSLTRESLTELSDAQLASVAGGAPHTWYVGECLAEIVDTMQPTRCLCPY